MKVTSMISYEQAGNYTESFGGMGGFFGAGMRWKDYLDAFEEEKWPYAEAVREYIIANAIKRGGDWHQNSDQGVPLFHDGTVATFSFRAWGDLMAAIWSEEENRNYSYMDFYMECLVGGNIENRN